MKILFFGGTGFVGEYLSKKLVDNGHELIVIHKSELKPADMIAGASYKKINLDNNADAIKKAALNAEVAIFALPPDASRLKNIISAILPLQNLKKIIYLSTLLVYPDALRPSDETVHPKPKTEYEKAKLQEEEILTCETAENKVKLCIARLGNVYGDIRNKGIINYIFLTLFKDNPFVINGNGVQIRDYIFIAEAARFLNILVDYRQTEKIIIFNICTGKGTSILQLIELAQIVARKKISFSFGQPVLEKKSVIGDNQKILGLNPALKIAYYIEAGMKETYFNYKNKII